MLFRYTENPPEYRFYAPGFLRLSGLRMGYTEQQFLSVQAVTRLETAVYSYSFLGFHSRASRSASAIWAGIIFSATEFRFFVAFL